MHVSVCNGVCACTWIRLITAWSRRFFFFLWSLPIILLYRSSDWGRAHSHNCFRSTLLLRLRVRRGGLLCPTCGSRMSDHQPRMLPVDGMLSQKVCARCMKRAHSDVATTATNNNNKTVIWTPRCVHEANTMQQRTNIQTNTVYAKAKCTHEIPHDR